MARSLSLSNQLSELAGDSIPSASGSDEGWYGGGGVLLQSEGPGIVCRKFVEKQIGIGNTLNFAHKQALYFMAYILFGAMLILVWVWAAM